MATYRLRAAKRQEDGTLGLPTLDTAINADCDADAIEEAKTFPLERLINEADLAWLIGPTSAKVWQIAFAETLGPA